MRKFIVILCTVIYFMCLIHTVSAVENGSKAKIVSYKILIDNREIQVENPIILIKDRTYLPLRELAESLNLYVIWDEQNKLIKVSDIDIVYEIDNPIISISNKDNIIYNTTDFEIKINGYIKNLENPIITINDRAYLPLREIAELLELEVEWIGESKTIVISTMNNHTYKENQLIPFQYDGLWGYMDKNGKVIIKPQYAMASFFSDSLAAVVFAEDDYIGFETSKWNFIDMNGNVVLYNEYYSDENFSEGLVTIYFNNDMNDYMSNDTEKLKENSQSGCNIMDKNGSIVGIQNFDLIESFHEGYAVAKTFDGRLVYIDKTGRIAADFGDTQLTAFKNGYAVIGNNKIINKNFEIIFYNDMYDKIILSDKFIVAEKNNKYGVVDYDNNIIIDFKYDNLSEFSDGLFAFKNQFGAGYIDINDNVIIPPDYEWADIFLNGIAIVGEKNNEHRFDIIDKNGKYIQRDIDFDLFYYNDNGVISVYTLEGIQYINDSGQIITPEI